MTIHDLIILGRLDRIIRREIRKQKHVCPECGRLLYYSAADATLLHEGGSYLCPNNEGDA